MLVIRGELLKKYPNAVIYAQLAQWQMTGGVIDPAKERVLVPLTDAQQDDPPADLVKMPLYEARVFPDIAFFGFDLTVDEARGGNESKPDDPPGWFFCIKERPGEPRFGFDVDRSGPGPDRQRPGLAGRRRGRRIVRGRDGARVDHARAARTRRR